MHQTKPVILDESMSPLSITPLPIFFESRYSKIVKAFKFKLPAKSTLFNYVSGKDYSNPEVMIEMTKHFSIKKNINSSIDSIFTSLTDKEDDQLIMAIKLL